MKKIFAAVCALGMMTASVFADELKTSCEAYMGETGGDASGCSCLAEASDSDMTAELLAVASEADLENLSDASKKAIKACWPDA